MVVVALNDSAGAEVEPEFPGSMLLCTCLEFVTTEVSIPYTDLGVGRPWGNLRPGEVLLAGCVSVKVSTVSSGEICRRCVVMCGRALWSRWSVGESLVRVPFPCRWRVPQPTWCWARCPWHCLKCFGILLSN